MDLLFILGSGQFGGQTRHCGTAQCPVLVPSKVRSRVKRQMNVQCQLPESYDALRGQAQRAVKAALGDGLLLQEVQFPPVANLGQAALNQVLDANRKFVREFVREFVPAYGVGIRVLLPDSAEVRLAKELWGQTQFSVSSIGNGADADKDKMIVCVNPGFNVAEWLSMEKLEIGVPLVAVNADFDKVRSGYYPRIFYPGLHKAKDRFFSRFETVYYLKVFASGGTLFRSYPGQWELYTRDRSGEQIMISSQPDRPAMSDVDRELRRLRDSRAS